MTKLKDLELGALFNIEKTPSYPKLKTATGYVDIRDNITNDTGNCDDKKVYLMTVENVKEQEFAKGSETTIEEWIEEKRRIFCQPIKKENE